MQMKKMKYPCRINIIKRNEIGNIPKYMEASGTDIYNNKVGRKFSATKSDALKELNKVFINQLNRMREEGPNYKFKENIDFKLSDGFNNLVKLKKYFILKQVKIIL